MDDSVFQVACPCCGAKLEIDAGRRVLLSHAAPQPEHIPVDLREAVIELKSRENTRDQRFRERFEAERKHGEDLQKRFDGLLQKTRSEGPPKRPLRDIDLD